MIKGFSNVRLDRADDRSLQAQLADQMKGLIQSGALVSDERLPSTRSLAEELRVSRNTVVGAYDLLLAEGYLRSQRRSAFTVGKAASAFRRARMRPGEPVQVEEGARKPYPPVPFRPAQPDVTLFPMKAWTRHRNRVLRGASSLLHYQSRFAIGLDDLRRAVADYLRDSRGVRCHWSQVAITGGSQQALYLLGQLLLQERDAVYMEDPGYPGATRAWQQARAKIVHVAVDGEGIRLPLPALPAAAMVYVTPSHQFPKGVCMSLARRLALLNAAEKRKLWVVEDDYDAEFRYTSAPQPSLQGLDDAGRVIYLGSFCKTLFPSLRLGYVVLPPSLVEGFTALKAAVDDHGPLLDQATLASFLESGAFYTHIRRCRRAYAERQEILLEAVRGEGLPLSFPVTGRGMSLAGLCTAREQQELSTAAEAAGLDLPSLESYCTEADVTGFLFGFTAFDAQTIRSAVRSLADAFAKVHAREG